jgi:hypothetical protein
VEVLKLDNKCDEPFLELFNVGKVKEKAEARDKITWRYNACRTCFDEEGIGVVAFEVARIGPLYRTHLTSIIPYTEHQKDQYIRHCILPSTSQM